MTDELPKTRAEAIALGVARYFSGKTCKHGHPGVRNTNNGQCYDCRLEYNKVPHRIERQRGYRYKHRHRWLGITEPTRLRPECCEVCGVRPKGVLQLDHDHSTGAFRGWLCRECNLALGNVRDSPHTLRRLSDYLETAGHLDRIPDVATGNDRDDSDSRTPRVSSDPTVTE